MSSPRKPRPNVFVVFVFFLNYKRHAFLGSVIAERLRVQTLARLYSQRGKKKGTQRENTLNKNTNNKLEVNVVSN